LCAIKSGGKIAAGGDGSIYVSRPDTDEVLKFADGADGNVAPADTLGGEAHSMLRGPVSLAVDADGRILVADTGVRVTTDYYVTRDSQGNPQYNYYYGAPVAPSVRLFVGTGDVSALAEIDGVALDVAVAPNAEILVLPDSSSEVDVYQFSGTEFGQTATIGGSLTGLVHPIAVGEDGEGKVYALDDRCNGRAIPPVFQSAIVVFAPGAGGNAEPTAVIDGPRTGLACP